MESQRHCRSSTAQTREASFSCRHTFGFQLFLASKVLIQSQARVRKHSPRGCSFRDGKTHESSAHTQGSTGWHLSEALLPAHLQTLHVKQQQQTSHSGSSDPESSQIHIHCILISNFLEKCLHLLTCNKECYSLEMLHLSVTQEKHSG